MRGGGQRGRGVHSGLLLCHQVSSLRERLESANSALQEEVRGRAEEQLQQREATERAAQEKAMLERDLGVARWREREGAWEGGGREEQHSTCIRHSPSYLHLMPSPTTPHLLPSPTTLTYHPHLPPPTTPEHPLCVNPPVKAVQTSVSAHSPPQPEEQSD